MVVLEIVVGEIGWMGMLACLVGEVFGVVGGSVVEVIGIELSLIVVMVLVLFARCLPNLIHIGRVD